ncbi:MAG: hypothetical protein COB37_04450 [Kordiimonadales bacterium]|nr:MAG: hypothetical protein COB37_04450 [Kordiimonadales bacterium]
MKLFFCVSAPRAGSTLLTRMLDSHSQIAAPYEIPVAKFFFGTQSENLRLDKVIQICESLGVDISRAIEDPHFYFQRH